MSTTPPAPLGEALRSKLTAKEGESAKNETFSERVARLNSDPAHRANVAAEKEAADRDIRDAIARRP